MTEKASVLKNKHILAVDDEKDILETITDILESSEVKLDMAGDYRTASEKMKLTRYDLVILDIMGVNGMKLLEEATDLGIPAVMLTAHSINPESLMDSISKGAISYLPKEKLGELDELLEQLLGEHENGRPPWKLLFDKLGNFFDERFGKEWKKKDQNFWTDFSNTFEVSKGIQERLKHDKKIIDKGI